MANPETLIRNLVHWLVAIYLKKIVLEMTQTLILADIYVQM